MNTEKDFYKILGIDKENFNEDTLKKNYRKLCRQWHPDKFATAPEKEQKKAEEKFKEISEAYDVLSDPQKKQQYDMGGNGIDLNDIFQHFGGFPFGGGMGGMRQRVNKGTNAKAYVFMTLKEAYNGGNKEIKVTRNKSCSKCNGTGSADGINTTCPHCNGTGMISEHKQMGPGSFSISQRPCPHCQATGKIITKPCKHCKGTGVESENTTETIKVPRGVVNGLIINVPGAGNAPQGGSGVNGDLLIEVVIKNDSYFERPDEINLIHYAEVPFNECILGFEKEFEAIDGTKVKVKAPELTPHGKSFIFKGKGMPHYNNPNMVGDYAVVINYKLPDKLTDEQKKKLKDF